MLRLKHIITVGFLFIGLSASLHAEEIVLPDPKADTSEYTVELPGRGMTMETVQNRFGEALSKEPAVGTPPISKWSYQNFSVYFESEYVIHAVVNH